MSTFVKKYPRARVTPTLNGFAVDILMGAKSRPSRIKATYATIPFAIKAAHGKLGVPTINDTPAAAAPVLAVAQPAVVPADAGIGYGICESCARPMRKAGMRAADYPGTVARRRDGICQSCALKQERDAAA